MIYLKKGIYKLKKILFFIPTLTGGGAEKVLVNLLNNLDKGKYDITLLVLFDYGVNKKKLSEDIKYRYVFKKIFRGNIHILKLFSPKFLYKKMIKENYDIAVSYLEGPTTRILAGCEHNNIKLINWVHTDLEDFNVFLKPYRSKKEMHTCYNRYDANVCVSNTVKEVFQSKVINDNKDFVIRNIVDTGDIIKKAGEEITNKDFNKDTFKLISVGRLTDVKGYERLLRVHKKLLNEGFTYSLYILGEGKQKAKLEQYIKDNNIQGNTYLLGYDENPYKYVKNSDLFICSSYKEGYSTAVTESIIAGTPVLTTLCSGMNEILDGGKYGMIVENKEQSLYDGIKKLLQDKELLKKYKNSAIERAKYFNIENGIKEVEDLFENILK